MAATETVDSYETQLEAHQVEWVRKGIEARYARSHLVNGPLIGTKDVPDFPSMEVALQAALKQLTREQVAYMMEPDRPPFIFQMRLITPSSRLDLQRRLINHQPRRMDTSDQTQQDVYIPSRLQEHLAGRPSSRKMEWEWEFVQGDDLIKGPQEGDDTALGLRVRMKRARQSRPKGMRGVDRYTWTTLMADSLREGRPLDIHFKEDATGTTEHEKWLHTILDEEGEFKNGGYTYLVGGDFDPYARDGFLDGYFVDGHLVDGRDRDARFRTSVGGPVESMPKKKTKSPGVVGELLKSIVGSSRLKLAAALLLGSAVGAKVVGTYLAKEAIEDARVKLAIAAYVDNGAKKDQAIGYVFGGSTKAEGLDAADNSIPIDPGEMTEDGGLYYWYQAMMILEDKGHDGGFSDVTGINPRMPVTIALRQGGGSSLADQACGALRDGISDYQYYDPTPETLTEKLGYYPGWLRKKAEETLCGIGIAGIRSPQEIAAYYATYQYIAPRDYGVGGFIQKYWGISDVKDLNVGQQLLLAAFFNLPWNGSDWGWEKNQRRALYALDQLIEDGIIPREKVALVKREITSSKPKLRSDYKDIAPKRGYSTGMGLAVYEAKTYFGDDFRSDLRSIHTTLDPSVLTTAYWACENTLVELGNDLARCVILAVDSSTGEIIAMDSRGHGDQFGFNRFFTERSPGSMGKILLAAGVGNKHMSPPTGNPYSSSFYDHLSRSSAAIIDDARSMGVSKKTVEELISCYGKPHEDVDPIEGAGMGMFETSPLTYIQTLYEAYTGMPSPNPFVVSAFTDNEGEVHKTEPVVRENGKDCAVLAYADGYTKDWLKAPLDTKGTLSILSDVADIGKTGTVGSRGSSGNSMVWAMAGKAYPDGHFYTVLAGFGSDNNEEIMGLGTGGEVAGPAVREVLLSIDKRKRQNAL